MRTTTLCYIRDRGKTLLLHRTRKRNDPNAGKWIGIGGGLEPNETIEECLLREVREETGLRLIEYIERGLVHFRSDTAPDEDMVLFTATGFTGTLTECDEGELKWIDDEQVPDMPTWEGDRVFLKLLRERDEWFELTLRYEGERLVEATLNGGDA